MIKDFLIEKYPLDKDKISRMPISNCINLYIESKQLKEVAKRSVWLGNDHAHYMAKWTDKNIDDFISLIFMCIDYIDLEANYEKVMQDMKIPK